MLLENDIFKTVLLSSPMVVFAKQGCPYCKTVVEVLNKKKIVHTVIYINMLKPEYMAQFRANLLKRTGRTSVPTVFIGERYIGGCNDASPLGIDGIIPLLNTNRLDKIYINSPIKKLPFNLY